MSFGDIFILLLIFVPLLLLWIFALADLAGREDLSGVAKGLWAVAIALLPIIGMVIYFATQPDDQEPRSGSAPSRQKAEAETTTSAMIDDLEQLAALHENGTLSADEFASAKERLLVS